MTRLATFAAKWISSSRSAPLGRVVAPEGVSNGFSVLPKGRAGSATLFRLQLVPVWEGPVDSEMNAVMAKLANEGIRVDIDASNENGEVVIAELPNGDRYKFARGSLFKLMAQGKLNVAGILEAGTKG
jgi:hypothetical protein